MINCVRSLACREKLIFMEKRLQPTYRSIDEITESMQKSFIEKITILNL